VKQQHCFQHCSAEAHPHVRSWQGNGWDLPFSASLLNGNGMNEAQIDSSSARPTSLRLIVHKWLVTTIGENDLAMAVNHKGAVQSIFLLRYLAAVDFVSACGGNGI
jgi:hypothetical protein